MHLILGMESEENVIYVHSDMLQEMIYEVELSHTVGNEGLSGVRQSCSSERRFEGASLLRVST